MFYGVVLSYEYLSCDVFSQRELVHLCNTYDMFIPFLTQDVVRWLITL